MHVCLGRRGKPPWNIVISPHASGGTEIIRHSSQVGTRVDSGNS